MDGGARVGEPGLAVGSADTFPKLLVRNAAIRGERPAYREKDFGIWNGWSWSQVRDNVREIACGFAADGFRAGDRLAIVGDNRPQLYWSIIAAQCLGGVPVPLYQDSVAEEMSFVVDHAEARFAVAEDQEQVDKLLEIKERCPKLERIYYKFPRGLRNYRQPFLSSLEALQQRGREYDSAHPGFFDAQVKKGSGGDLAIILYTSGTTGQPKGVMLTHANLIVTAENSLPRDQLTERDEILAYLPMAWVGDNIFSVAQAFCAGFCVNCPESNATVLDDLREIGPTYFFAPPRVYEGLLTQVMIRMEDASRLKRWMFERFMALARRVGMAVLDGKAVATVDRLLYALGRILVYEPLKNTLGFSRIRLAYTAGEAIGPEIFEFYRSLGMNVKQLYGMTEAAVFVTVQEDGAIKKDTVGKPVKDVEIRIEDGGEILFRSPGVFQAYYKDDAATSSAKTADGWVRTGDAGFLDGDGQLKIIDRAKDVGKLNDGTLFAPKYIENKLKFFSYIKDAVAFGTGRDCVVAFINIDLEAVGNWAERRHIAYSGYTALATNAEVNDLIKECVETVNADLAREAELKGSQIRRFLILHKELDADDGELTRTGKVRRRIIDERYQELIEALFAGRDSCEVEAKVTFEDGRTGVIRADLKICEAKRF